MKISRGELLSRLHEAAIGLSSKEVLEQSNCFVFKGETLTTFNDNIMVRVANPLGFDVVVNAANLMGILSKMPDEEIDIRLGEGELRVKSPNKARAAGIACVTDVALPLDAVPAPEKWFRLQEGVNGLLQQAARTCGTDEQKYLTTVVHVTPDRIEACDDSRLFRVDVATGFPQEILLPAASVHELESMEITRVSVSPGWAHFKTASGARISVRCSHEKYHDGLDAVLEMDKPVKLVLPSDLKDLVERASVFHSAQYNDKMNVEIADGELVLRSRKDGGWYRERNAIPYTGRPLVFEIQPQFLVSILERTRDVKVDNRKMKIVSDKVQFVVSLSMKAEDKSDDDAPEKPATKPKKAKTVKDVVSGEEFAEDDIPF